MNPESSFVHFWTNRPTSWLETITLVTVLLLFSLLLNGCVPPQVTPNTAPSAYVDPALATRTGNLSVVVTGQSAECAAEAVRAAGGSVTSELWLINAVGATIAADTLDQLAATPTILSIVENKRIAPSTVVRKKAPPETDVAWPVSQDVGTDQLHAEGITGEGVTVAVIDSGVTFYKKLADGTDADVVLNYAGQFDFSEDKSCSREIDGYCFQKTKDARDLYGHGSHVAGIIGNGYLDSGSGAYLGIAPDAEILSFRALTDQGVGSYEQTIEALQAVAAMQDKYDIRIVNLSLSATASVPYFVDPLNRAV
ncbi:MAG: S8 family serine peptidase, partial [Caldilineaceae bacterium]|nr:S8 family serine peptidase [Caldilineaceae bacterium]